MTASPKEVRAARAFLTKKGIRTLSPRKFADSAKELNTGFRDLLHLLGRILDQGRGQKQQRDEAIDREILKLNP